MPRQGIWITGVGCATSLGLDVASLGRNVIAGRSGVEQVRHFDTVKHPSRIASCLPAFEVPEGWDAADFHQRSPWMQLLLWCAVSALQDAGLWTARRSLRVGVVVGIGAEWLQHWENDFHAGGQAIHDPNDTQPGLVPQLHSALALEGPCATVAAACASGNVAIGVARQWLENDWVDICLAGGADRGVTPMGLAGFGNLGALSTRNEEPQRACRPFDRNRDGFVLGEGGALLVLESEDLARARDATAYGQVLGYAARSDASHPVMPSLDPRFATEAIQGALADAGLSPRDVDYINAHATATPAGDAFEVRALRQAFGPYLNEIPVSSTKSMTGHLLSAASAVEAVISLAALEHQAVPPTLNLEDVDPECELRHVPHRAMPHPIDVVLSNSFGFGGANTALLLGQAPADARRRAA